MSLEGVLVGEKDVLLNEKGVSREEEDFGWGGEKASVHVGETV